MIFTKIRRIIFSLIILTVVLFRYNIQVIAGDIEDAGGGGGATSTECVTNGGVCGQTSASCVLYGGSTRSWWCTGGTGSGTCCVWDNLSDIKCESDADCDSCERCDNDGTINSKCVSTTTTGAKGVCGTANGSSFCSYPSTGKCSTTYGVTAIDTVGNDGNFNWKCEGQSAGTCRTAGADATCAATKIATVNGVCGTSNGGYGPTRPTTGLCTDTTGMSWVDQVATDGTYNWTCGQCDSTPASCLYNKDNAPSFVSIVLGNLSTGKTVPVDVGNKNHSCQFSNDQFKVLVSTSDPQGVTDIGKVYFRFDGGGTVFESDSIVGGVATFNSIDFSTLSEGNHTIEIKIDDVHFSQNSTLTTGWVNRLTFYVWDCQVIVDGTLYENSANLGCSNSNNDGFTTPISTDIDLFTFAYGDLTDSSTRNMTVVSPRFYSPDYLTWQNNYFLTFDDFLGVFRSLKVNDTCVSWNSHLSPSTYVNAYDSNPTINLKYSAIMDQESWYRVLNGGVFSKTNITNYVPVTCVSNCKTSSNGLIWSKDVYLSSSDIGTTAIADIRRPISYDYEELKYDIYSGKEVGTTIATTETTVLWSQIDTNKGVIFIDRDFTIDSNIDPTSEPTLIVVKGDIIIEDNVTQITGMLFADGTIQASGENDTQLTITGALYSKGGVILNRSYVTKRTNNTVPAVEITYDPNLVFNLDPKLWYIYDNWTLE